MLKIKIAHLYPDLLEVYSDRGNVKVLEQRALWRGIDVQIDHLSTGDTTSFEEYDLIFSGGGEDREQWLVGEDLLRKRDSLVRAIDSGSVLLTICGSYQLLGHYFETIGGDRIEGVGLIDVYTVGGEKRLVGNSVSTLSIQGVENTIVGYENHSGRTYLGEGVEPLAKVQVGSGNNGEDGREGARSGNIWGTYYHGPFLSKNPRVADLLLETALQRRYNNVELHLLDDQWEQAAHDQIVKQYTGQTRAESPHMRAK